MNVLEKAQELADALAGSPEIAELRGMEEKIKKNPEAEGLINEFRFKQMQYYNLQMEGKEATEEMMKEVQELQDRMEENQLVMDYMSAQERVGKILEQVNAMISRALQGDSCASGECCSGCSGCN